MLIRNAEVYGRGRADVRIRGGVVAQIAACLLAEPEETVIEAHGAALLPGLHDHHLHLPALAAALDSVYCGPPQVSDALELGRRLHDKAASIAASGGGWIRGIGFCESVAGDIDRFWLDRFAPSVPVRVQHRSGRLWILNSRALEIVAADTATDAPHPLERKAGQWTGRLYDADAWLRRRLRSTPPNLQRASAQLAGFGVTGLSEVTPHNTLATLHYFSEAQVRGDLLQDVRMMGDASLNACPDTPRLCGGARKIHLHESALPELDELVTLIAETHEAGRAVAVHCVTLAELMFTLGALAQAGAHPGDRIEHAAVAPPDVVPLLRAQGVTVVTQPNFIGERGDRYLREVDAADRPWLYRGRAWLHAGIPLAAGTDAPFGRSDPWFAMQCAVTRRSAAGSVLDAAEALTPEEALALFLGPLDTPGVATRRVEAGAPADLCLLDRTWQQARADLAAVKVTATLKAGSLIYRR